MMPVQVLENKAVPTVTPIAQEAIVYCPICTHSVSGKVRFIRNAAGRKVPSVIAGQRCTRCNSPLDPGVVLHLKQAA